MADELATPLLASASPAVETSTSTKTAEVAKTEDAPLLSGATTKETEVAKVGPDKNADGTPKTPEQKAADEKAAADKKVSDEKAAKDLRASTAPEKYEAFAMPEGVNLSEENVTAFSALAKEDGLTQAQAQKYIDLATNNAKAGAEAVAKAQAEQWVQVRSAWKAEIAKDPVIGGANLKQSTEYAIRAAKQFSPKGELDTVFSSGWGDNPALFRAFVNIGKRLSEDTVVDGSAPKASTAKSVGDVFYPNHGKS